MPDGKERFIALFIALYAEELQAFSGAHKSVVFAAAQRMLSGMRARIFQFRTQGVRGLPAALLLGLGVVVVLAAFVLLLFVGAAVAVGALVLSVGFALWHGLRRKLNLSGAAPQSRPLQHEPRPFFEDAPAPVGQPSATLTEAREIEVEVLPARER